MATGKKTGGRDFQPGTSGNSNGRPKTPSDVKALVSLNNTEFVRLCTEFLYMSEEDLRKVAADPKEIVLKKMISNILKVAIETGDHKRLEFFLDRLVGKPVKTFDNSGTVSMHAEIVKMIEEAEEAANAALSSASSI